MKKIALILVAVCSFFIIAGCEPRITEEEARTLLTENRELLASFADTFSRQDIVHMAVWSSNRMGVRYYTISLQNDDDEEGITYKVPSKYKNDDTAFWETNPSEIVSTEETGSVPVREILDQTGLAEEDFHTWRLFLQEHHLLSIERSGVNGLVEIRITPKMGYIYAPEIGEHLVTPEGVVLSQIDEHWSFFIMQ